MQAEQKVKTQTFIYKASEMSEGAGVDVNRLFPVMGRMMNFDPFVLWDNFMIGPDHGFPTHPHRGFEAITYMFEGSIEHKDNLGNQSRVTTGGAQRFTAGRGIEHSEMPDAETNSNGIQLWINLAKSMKAIEPGYQQANQEDIPVKEIAGGKINIIVGEGSPVKLHTPVRYLSVNLDTNATHNEPVPADFRGFVYLVAGKLVVNGETLDQTHAYFFETGIQELEIQAVENSHYMLCMGRPHRESIRQYGPFVD